MLNITSRYAPYTGGYRLHPTGRQWLNPKTGEPGFADYAEAYEAVRAYLLSEQWAPTPGEVGPRGGLSPEGHEQSWFTYGRTSVDNDGETIQIEEL